MSTIVSTKQLLARVIEHSKLLIHTDRTDQSGGRLSTGELINVLCFIGIQPPNRPRFSPRNVNLTEIIAGAAEEEEIVIDIDLHNVAEQGSPDKDPIDSLLKSAYQVLNKWQWSPLKQYFFPISK